MSRPSEIARVAVVGAAIAAGACGDGAGPSVSGRRIEQASAEVKEETQDAAITAKVKAAIIREPELKSTQINVDTLNGDVTLSGAVETEHASARAEEVAERVEGVRSVANRLIVGAAG